MENKTFLKLLVLFLGFSYVLSSTATILKSENENPSQVQVQVQDLLAQEATEISDSEELLGVDQAYIEGRMDMESTDYPGTGANNHHDPKTPGRA
ncbi:Calcium-transporting ATPase 9, plasma membrane-type-like protein [Melia azedarach]|uniref:Calcium-transporting ATPase 9, plasma membrane-type-like protein n=1 Tax=Melia azedarach TaxID=155640 RepID=A0ACC1YCZ7_MELAZ|nr:Calcium-transporting ATPase 9, plasma membrane-type-like protein [Melia azedarach]